MNKNEAITLHLKNWERFPVFVWQEGDHLVTEVDGVVVREKTLWRLETKLDGIAPSPRNLYFVDAPDYENEAANTELAGVAPTKHGE
jgi:hypothetical protein